jgi:hypothetical protein
MVVEESAVPPEGWTGSGGKVKRIFERVSIYNGEAGAREYELAPDENHEQGTRIVQVWRVKDHRDMNVFLRCRFRETPVVLIRNIPAGIDVCRFTFSTDGRGRITGKPAFGCK